MWKVRHHFKRIGWFLALGLLIQPFWLEARDTWEFRKQEMGSYKDVFDQNVYYEGTNLLHFDRLGQKIFHCKVRSKNVNNFDEVPDNSFFTNRHAKKPLSIAELEKGPQDAGSPDLNGNLTVFDGEFFGEQPNFFVVRDSKGTEYILGFDPASNLELTTSAEVIASRFYHAIGYQVPEYNIVEIAPEKFVVDPNGAMLDNTGFYRKLTPQRLGEYLQFLALNANNQYRASARKVLNGILKGEFKFSGRRKDDPDDKIDHEDRREVRALRVFASWLNHDGISETSAWTMLESANGKDSFKNYLVELDTALGSESDGAKIPDRTHEYLFDYGDTFKEWLAAGWWEKPWQKRWREAGEQPNESFAVGYIDNRYFNPERFKTRLPYYAFKDLTRADGFWAAKIIMSFKDEDIQAMVKAGQLSLADDAAYLAKILIERRNLISRYWFSQTNPLERFSLKGNILSFEDFSVKYGFSDPQGTKYQADLFEWAGNKWQKIKSIENSQPQLDLGKLNEVRQLLRIVIRAQRGKSLTLSPYVAVEINSQGVQKIEHED